MTDPYLDKTYMPSKQIIGMAISVGQNPEEMGIPVKLSKQTRIKLIHTRQIDSDKYYVGKHIDKKFEYDNKELFTFFFKERFEQQLKEGWWELVKDNTNEVGRRGYERHGYGRSPWEWL